MSIISILILILLLAYLVACFFIAYHLIRFGIGIESKILSIVFIAGIVFLIILLFSSLDSAGVDFFNI
jgi:hypothetical protein